MELELERTELNGYETVLDTTLTQEETLEAIVPDACPDILRRGGCRRLLYGKNCRGRERREDHER